MSETAEILVRPGEPDDHAFVMATWLRAFRHGSLHGKRLTNDVYFTNHHPLVTDIVARSEVWVAALPDDPRVIIGYLVTEHQGHVPVLHFAYTKDAFRRMRVFTQLREAAGLPLALMGVEVSHPTFDWLEFLAPKYPGARSNPYRWQYAPKEAHAPA